MRYTDFTKRFKKSGVVESTRSYLQLLEKMEDGKVLINGVETEFDTIEEARQYIKQDYIAHQLEEQATKELYEELSENTIANIINKYHSVKVTDTLVESYKELASSNMFSVDPVVYEIRSLNKLDRIIEGKITYTLNDGSIVAISEDTQDKLNKLLHNHTDVIDHMRESKDNFMMVVSKIEE
jgi:hypothetical protein